MRNKEKRFENFGGASVIPGESGGFGFVRVDRRIEFTSQRVNIFMTETFSPWIIRAEPLVSPLPACLHPA